MVLNTMVQNDSYTLAKQSFHGARRLVKHGFLERTSPQLLIQCFIFYILFALDIVLNEHKVPLLPRSLLYKLENGKHKCLPRRIKAI